MRATHTLMHIYVYIYSALNVSMYIYIHMYWYTLCHTLIYMCVCDASISTCIYIVIHILVYIYIIYIEFLEVLNRNSSTNTSTNQQLHQTRRHLAWAVPRSRAPQALPAESPKQRRGEQATNEAGAGTAKGGWIMILTTIPKRNGGLPHQVSSIGWVAGKYWRPSFAKSFSSSMEASCKIPLKLQGYQRRQPQWWGIRQGML